MQFKNLLIAVLCLCYVANTDAQQTNCLMTTAPAIAVPADTELCVGEMFTASTAVAATGLPNTEYLVTDQNQIAGDGGPLILGADADGVFSPTDFGLTAGDEFCVTAVAYDLEQVQTVLEGLLTGSAAPLGSCCGLVDFVIPQFCINLAAMGITSGEDITTLNDIFTLVGEFSAATTTFSAQSFLDQLNLLNTTASTLPATCGTDGLPLCYAIDLNVQACFTVTGTGTLNANAGPDTTICDGEPITLTATGGTSYIWSNGENTPEITISPSSAETYSVTVANVCASGTDEVTVSVLPTPDPSIAIGSNGNLIAQPAGQIYQWHFNGMEIPGATAPNHTPLSTGDYTVEVTNADGCSAISVAIPYVIVGTGNIEGVEKFEVFPNPFNDFIDINLKNHNLETFYAKIVDIRGEKLFEKKIRSTGSHITRINVADLPKGIYFIQLSNDNGQIIKKLAK